MVLSEAKDGGLEAPKQSVRARNQYRIRSVLSASAGRHYYIRQLRDIKIKFAVETFGKALMLLDAQWCGHTLAFSHARSGESRDTRRSQKVPKQTP